MMIAVENSCIRLIGLASCGRDSLSPLPPHSILPPHSPPNNNHNNQQKGLLRTHCPLRAQSFARMLHRTQRTFPAHMTPGAWRLADVRLLNTVMAGRWWL